MPEQSQKIRDERLFKFASAKRYLKIYVPGFAFKHDDNSEGKDRFVGREVQLRKLYTWLTSDSKSGSYLITGYRGMGKSLLVKRVIELISREPKAYKEVLFQVSMILTIVACFFLIVKGQWEYAIPLVVTALLIVGLVELSKIWNYVLYERNIRHIPMHRLFSKDMLAKVWLKMHDRRHRDYATIPVTINLGQEVLHERDVLSLITQNVREKYTKFVHNRQNRPFVSYILLGGICAISFWLTKIFFYPVLQGLGSRMIHQVFDNASWFTKMIESILLWIRGLLHDKGAIGFISLLSFYLFFFYFALRIGKALRKYVPYFSLPFTSLDRLNVLCDRIISTFSEEQGSHPQYSSSLFNFSFGKEGRSKSTPKATVRELEQELLTIVNNINGDDCPKEYRVQFIFVFDELDKITNDNHKNDQRHPSESENAPEFDTSVKGFTDEMAFEERKQNVLRLLANMKLFIASVKAKCVFISGHELFDASLADLSDREFAISSIFNGVLNVSSFLSPERDQADVSSMTEVYLATMLLPENYLKKKIENNLLDNGVLKDELPSLRWYNEYLMELHVLNNPELNSEADAKEKEVEIRHVMEFLRCFSVFLSHVSNGSPKKIATYFEKYIQINYDAVRQFDWHDIIVVGEPSEMDVRKQCVLFFDLEDQKLINFIHYFAAPVMNAITNEVSHYGDKLLVSSSFMLDQIYKYHGKGFSWRNLEQMPELLNLNKNPELRDSMASIMEFLLQTHVTQITSGVFQYKFHKQIAEEISTLSKTSEEAAAIFNFTLNESETVKRYNTRLLWHYASLAKDLNDGHRYNNVLERLHENLGDIYFSEEDYYRAIHEYRCALQCMNTSQITSANVLPYLKCNLKIGISYEYRRTFENAFMVYCQIINQLIHLQWFDEDKLGLDHTMRLTGDWRTKKSVFVDKESTEWVRDFRQKDTFRSQFQPELKEDIEKHGRRFYPRFSMDSDQAISGLSSNYTPEKSDILLNLIAFEDVKYIYQAIIAKLFVIEKMGVSGITQSSIDAAEAEFISLYSATNHHEKFILASDFFSKLAGILYYKNNYVSTASTEKLSSLMYIFDINVTALLDDYCFSLNGTNRAVSAIKVKDDVHRFFDELKIDSLNKKISKFKDLIPNLSAVGVTNKLKGMMSEVEDSVKGYLDYLDGLKQDDDFDLGKLWNRLQDCSKRRERLSKAGYRLPCNACKYANRSLLILMKKVFNEDTNESLSITKSISLLINTSHKHLRYLRREHLSALAYSAEQLADIMLSCACTNRTEAEDKAKIWDTISNETIALLASLAESTVPEQTRVDEIKKYSELFKEKEQKKNRSSHQKTIGKLDRALLYYWSASRYYEIASMYQESTHCLHRIAKVIEDYLSVLAIKKDKSADYKKALASLARKEKEQLVLERFLDHLFTHSSRMIARQYNNFNMAEIHESKWVFHLEHYDDIDLTKLTQFPDVQSLFLSIIRSKVSLYHIVDETDLMRKNYVKKVYERTAPGLRHERTFKSEVELNYTKAFLNRIIFVDLLKSDIMKDFRLSLLSGAGKGEYHSHFFDSLYSFLTYDLAEDGYEKELFKIKGDIQSRLDLLDFLVTDSLVCLYNIIKILPPHNQVTSFSNSFVADVYDNLWEWSKYYELLYDSYVYYRHSVAENALGKKKIITLFNRLAERNDDLIESSLNRCINKMRAEKVVCKDDFGYRYSKIFMELRHEMDDTTIHHIDTNYSAEMAIKYYRAARSVNSEGMEYKNLIYGMYALDDDLRNDTCQSNLADERYMLNSGVISTRRKMLQRMYENSNITNIAFFEELRKPQTNTISLAHLRERFEDSPFINTEY